VVLLFLNIAAELLLNHSTALIGKTENSKIIEKKFLNVLNSFALKSEWIIKSHKTSKDSIINYRILIPKSIRLPIILNEMTISLEKGITKIKCFEESVGGNSTIKIFNDDKLKLSARLIYDEGIERSSAKLAFMVYCNSDFSKEELAELRSNLPVYHLIIPLTDYAERISSMAVEYGMSYSIVLNNEISSNFEIDEDDSKKSIISQVQRIIETFPSCSSFIVDPDYSVCSSKIYPFLKAEFKSREKELINKRKFHSLENKNESEQKSLLHFYCTKYADKDLQNIIVPFSDLPSLTNEIKKMQLKGHQFTQPEF